eukprot:Protomagalhaensia_sp_Gyna_25__2461@NODE_2373_length_1123_cov_190_755535_g1324_i1_p2_GENE_NODE_2373_length_1123_cov_190_755535_g1324_i1NODE_2373_length_1123_cov_190_755535_g1324_i1_p2_ORF_typecomplete_len113_score3_76_NODE_2373_length_1123_cov_190_755535_g1324_i17271065
MQISARCNLVQTVRRIAGIVPFDAVDTIVGLQKSITSVTFRAQMPIAYVLRWKPLIQRPLYKPFSLPPYFPSLSNRVPYSTMPLHTYHLSPRPSQCLVKPTQEVHSMEEDRT